MMPWNVACRAVVSYFLQSNLTYSCKKNGSNNKRTECLSNDFQPIFISVHYACAKSSIFSTTAISLS